MAEHVYIAHPIDSVDLDTMRAINREAARAEHMLVARGLFTYSPGAAWGVPRDQYSGYLQEINDFALRTSRATLALLHVSDRTLGVGIEIARSPGLVVAVVDKPRLALGRDVVQFSQLDQAVQFIAEHKPAHQVTQTRFALYQGDGKEPTRNHEDDAGFDLFYHGANPLVLHSGEQADVPSGVAVELPPGMWGLLMGRSSSLRNRGLLVNQAVIDPGYRGPLFAVTTNTGTETQTIQPGERIAQLVPMANIASTIGGWRHEALSTSDRGLKGFGSSGL